MVLGKFWYELMISFSIVCCGVSGACCSGAEQMLERAAERPLTFLVGGGYSGSFQEPQQLK